MTIITRPQNKDYDIGWDRTFAKKPTSPCDSCEGLMYCTFPKSAEATYCKYTLQQDPRTRDTLPETQLDDCEDSE